LRVFGTAGTRGIFNETQTPRQVYKIAETVAFAFGKGGYGVGWDGRKSSAVLARTVISAAMAVGSDTLTFGLVPTPVIAYGTRHEKCRAGFAVTASHNPAEFSGMKVFDESGMEISQEDEARVERALAVDSWKAKRDFGARRECDYVLDMYGQELRSRFSPVTGGLTILVDCANGPGALVTPWVLGELGHRVIPLNTHVSWRFPARPPEPTGDNVKDTAKLVVGLRADLGFTHDGDADRLVMINSAGQVVPDSMVSILAMRALNVKSRTVILSENTSSAVAEEAEQTGGRVVRSRVGKTFAKIGQENAVFATEPSKIVDPNWGMWEDGIYASALISDYLSKNRDAMNLLSTGTGWHYRQLNLRFGVDEEKLRQIANESLSRFKIAEERNLDGMKFVFKDGSWIMFRTSGTEPITRVYCESRDPARLQELVDEGVKYAQAARSGSSK
jgi:phosphopentomutase